MRVLDLFCGAGLGADGYIDAGFAVDSIGRQLLAHLEERAA